MLVDGKPDATVAVQALPFEDAIEESRREARREGLPRPLAETTARPDGSYVLSVAAPAGAVVRLAFAGPRAAPRVLEALFDAAGDDAGEARLAEGHSARGRVVDERGGPVVGATRDALARRRPRRDPGLEPARGVPQLATTKPDGSFRFESASPEANRLRVEAPAFATLERQPVRGGALSRPLALALGQVLRGTVTLADRKTPVKGALVRFEGRTQTTRYVEARADGGFVIDGAPREPGSLVADGGERGRGSPGARGGLDRGGAHRARADRDARRPRGRSRQRQAARGREAVARAESAVFLARSGPDGRYLIRGLGPRRYRLSAEDDRFVPWTRRVSVAAGQGETQDVPLARGATLVGRVVDPEGAPIEGARVQLLRSGENVFRAFVRRMEGEGGAVRTGQGRQLPGDAAAAGRQPAARRAPRRVRGARARRHRARPGRHAERAHGGDAARPHAARHREGRSGPAARRGRGRAFERPLVPRRAAAACRWR